MAAIGLVSAPRSPSSSVCSFAGSVNSEILQANKYLMKTLCLAKKSQTLPGKADYANLLTSGLGARKWVASLDFDAESFKGAIVNIYPRLSSVPSYTLWNVKPDKSFEKLPLTVNTPQRIKSYLGTSFTGSLIIMPSEEINLGPVKVPVITSSGNSHPRSGSSHIRSSTNSMRSAFSSKSEPASSGYESYQESNHGSRSEVGPSSYYTTHQSSVHSSSKSSHNQPHHVKQEAGTNGQRHRQICLICGRLAKQAGSTSFYDINNGTSFTTSDGYISIAKKLRGMFHLELPKSKLVPCDQICRKCFRAMNEIHFLETQLKKSKEDMMSNLFSTVAKISKLEQIAREQAASSSSDSSTTSLGTMMTTAALNPWFQAFEQRALATQGDAPTQKRSGSQDASATRTQDPASQEGPEGRDSQLSPSMAPKQQAQAMAIFQSHKSATGESYVDYSSPQPVFLAPLGGFAHSAALAEASTSRNSSGRNCSRSPVVDERTPAPQAIVPINLVSTHPSVAPETSSHPRRSPHVSASAGPMFINKPSPHYYAQSNIRDDREERRSKKRQERSDRERQVERESIEEQMAKEQMEAEEEADHKEASERDHAAYLEEAYRCRRRLEANEEKVANSRFSSNSSPDSQSPSPPTSSSNGGSDSTNISNNDNTLYIENTLKKYSSPKHEGSLSSKHESLSSRRSYWKKRYHDHKSADEQTSATEGESEKKIARTSKSPERKRAASGGHGSAELVQQSGSETTVMENDQEKQA